MEITEVHAGLVLSALVSTIVYLWKSSQKQHDETKVKLDASEKRDIDNNKTILGMHGKIERLDGEREGYKMGVERLSAAVIEEVRKLGSIKEE